MAAGIAHSWDSSIDIPGLDDTSSCSIWSPCGRFVATHAQEVVEIWDPLTGELLSTLHPDGSTPRLIGTHAYSPDGFSLACASDTAIIIWDIQTGGVAKEIPAKEIRFSANRPYDLLLVWSLDGRIICALTWDLLSGYTVRRFDVVSCTEQSSVKPHSELRPRLWAHDTSLRVMTVGLCAETDQKWDRTIDIFEVGPTLTKIESFDVRLGGNDQDIGGKDGWKIESFSPTTCRISVSDRSQDRLLVLDIRNWRRLLDETYLFGSHCFSPDGGIFAASQTNTVHIWKYDGSSCVAWRELSTPGSFPDLQFSPTSASVLGAFRKVLKVWHLDDLSAPPAPHSTQSCTFPRSGAYLVTARNPGDTITITGVLSQTPLQLIRTGTEIYALILTGNVLLAVSSEVGLGPAVGVAWPLTEGGW